MLQCNYNIYTIEKLIKAVFLLYCNDRSKFWEVVNTKTMGRIQKSVSISEEEALFVEENEISLSNLLQASIQNIRENFRISDKFVKELQSKVARLQETIEKQRNFIEANGLMDKFLGI